MTTRMPSAGQSPATGPGPVAGTARDHPAVRNTPEDTAHAPRHAIMRLLAAEGPLTRQDIAARLRLSLPTVAAHLRALTEEGAVEAAGERASTGGRRARLWQSNTRGYAAIGVAIRSTEIVCMAIDLAGGCILQRHTTIAARTDPVFYQRVALAVDECARAAGSHASVLGVGIAPPAHINAAASLDYARIAASITETTGLPVRQTERYCAHALAECRELPLQGPVLCLFLGNHIGSAVVTGGTVHTGTVEHMCLDAAGPACECGRRGCLVTYCAMGSLAEDGESLAGFFSVLEQGEVHHRERMRQWCASLGHAIANVHTVLPADVVLCGPVARYLDDAEIAQVAHAARPAAPAGARTPRVLRGSGQPYQDARGAALAIVDAHVARLNGTVPMPDNPWQATATALE